MVHVKRWSTIFKMPVLCHIWYTKVIYSRYWNRKGNVSLRFSVIIYVCVSVCNLTTLNSRPCLTDYICHNDGCCHWFWKVHHKYGYINVIFVVLWRRPWALGHIAAREINALLIIPHECFRSSGLCNWLLYNCKTLYNCNSLLFYVYCTSNREYSLRVIM